MIVDVSNVKMCHCNLFSKILTVLCANLSFSELMASDVDKKLQLSLWVHTSDG